MAENGNNNNDVDDDGRNVAAAGVGGAVPPGAGRGLRLHLMAGDLDAMDGLVDVNEEIVGRRHGDDDDDPWAAAIRLAAADHRDFVAGVGGGGVARVVGLNETPLTRAMSAGDFAEAERLVQEATDPEYLNDGAHSATPLTLALTGRSASYCGQPRNLRLARLLVERGANVNLRIPNHDLETASESPLELLTTFYLSLLKVFTPNNASSLSASTTGQAAVRKTLPHHDRERQYLELDLLDTVGLENEEKMTPQQLTAQTRELLYCFLRSGADIDLQTTEAGRTVFHLVLAAEVTDRRLVTYMVSEMSALVNLTDVHGSTPLMDVIRCRGDRDRGVETYRMLQELGKRLLLDAQNCSGESALFRSMFHGRLPMSHLLLDEGAASFSMARVQEDFQRRGRFTTYLHHRPCISNLPTLLAPLLGDSPCQRSAARSAGYAGSKFAFRADVFNEAVRAKIAPFVDLGWFCTREVEKTVHALIRAHTHFRHLTEDKVFQEIALIPLMFGHLTSGLRQQCLREVLNRVLFEAGGGGATSKDAEGKKKRGGGGRAAAGQQGDEGGSVILYRKDEEGARGHGCDDSACVADPSSSVFATTTATSSASGAGDNSSEDQQHVSGAAAADVVLESLSEPEMPSFLARRHFLSSFLDGGGARSRRQRQRGRRRRRRVIGDNWLLQEDPQYGGGQFGHRTSRSSEGLELEVSFERGAQLHDHSVRSADSRLEEGIEEEEEDPVGNLDRLLRETDDMMERLQGQMRDAETEAGAERAIREADEVAVSVDVLAQDLAAMSTAVSHEVEVHTSTPPPGNSSRHHRPVIVEQLERGGGGGVAELTAAAVSSSTSASSSVDGNLHDGPAAGGVAVTTSSSLLALSTTDNSSAVCSDDEEEDDDDDDDDASWGGAFSLSQSLYPNRAPSFGAGPSFFHHDDFGPPASSSSAPAAADAPHDVVVKSLTREKVSRLARQVGLPPGLLPCLELEVARLQLGLAVFRHRSIDCDRGCEGDDSASSDTSSTSSSSGDEDTADDESSWSPPDSLSGPSLTVSDSDELESSLPESFESYEPAVPARPRTLTSDSSDEDENGEEDEAVSVADRAPSAVRRDSAAARRRVDGAGSGGRSSSSEDGDDENEGEENSDKHEEELRGSSAGGGEAVPAAPTSATTTATRVGGGNSMPAEETQPPPPSLLVEDWFAFGGEGEAEATRRYLRQTRLDAAGFEASTDSDTDDEDEENGRDDAAQERGQQAPGGN